MDITIQNASVQDMDRLMKMIDGMSDEPPVMPSDDDAPMGGGCSVCGGDDHGDHDHPHDDASPEPSPCGSDDDEPVDHAQVMRKHMGTLANAANDVEEGRHGNAPANTNDGAPDVKGDTHTDYSIRGAIKNHHASTISGDNPLDDIKESEMLERYTGFTGRDLSIDLSKKKDDIEEAPPGIQQAKAGVQAGNAPAPSPTQAPAGAPVAPAPAPAPDPKVAQLAKQQQVSAQKAVGELAKTAKVLATSVKTMQTIAPGLGMDINKDPEIQAMQTLAGNLKTKADATAAAAKQIPDPTKMTQTGPPNTVAPPAPLAPAAQSGVA